MSFVWDDGTFVEQVLQVSQTLNMTLTGPDQHSLHSAFRGVVIQDLTGSHIYTTAARKVMKQNTRVSLLVQRPPQITMLFCKLYEEGTPDKIWIMEHVQSWWADNDNYKFDDG